MVGASIFIVGKGDPPVWEDLRGQPVDRTSGDALMRWALIQGGMQSGKTSVMICFPVEERWIVAETSLAMLQSVVAAAKGAEERWEAEARG